MEIIRWVPKSARGLGVIGMHYAFDKFSSKQNVQQCLLPSPSISFGVISVENLEDIEVKSLDEYIWTYMFDWVWGRSLLRNR